MMSEMDLIDYEDIHIHVPWGHIAGRWYGNRSVRPILALHGWQDNLGTWDRLIPLLPQHIGILCIDLPGHGRSSKYPIGIQYHVIDYVHVIILIMNEYKWDKVSLLGHSMGGIVCFMYTSLYPHTVDMLIEIDIIATPLRTIEYLMKRLGEGTEKLLIENERLEEIKYNEPPSFTYEQLEQKVYLGSRKSVQKDYSKHLLNRSITPSQLYPANYYFSRDGRLKYYHEFNPPMGLIVEMAKRIKGVNHLVIRAKNSRHLTNEMLENVLRATPTIEVHEVDGGHHLHLNKPEEVARLMTPFISRVRPSAVDRPHVQKDETRSKL